MVTVVIKHRVPRISRKSMSITLSGEAAGAREEGYLAQNGTSHVVIIMVSFRAVYRRNYLDIEESMIRN